MGRSHYLWAIAALLPLNSAVVLQAKEKGASQNPQAWIDCLNEAAKAHPDITSVERAQANTECGALYGDTIEQSRVNHPTPSPAEFVAMRAAAEIYLTRDFFDPQSAKFEWPHGFFFGSWKPLLGKRVTGYVTCGFVNGKNRFGGYVGRRAFVVVMQSRSVIYSDIDGENLRIVEQTCQKRSLALPPLSVEPEVAVGNVASPVDSLQALNQLANLLEKGLITREEFEIEKRKILANTE